MAIGSFKARIGRSRVDKFVSEYEAGYTLSIRSQMEEIERNILAVFKGVEEELPEILLEALRPTFAKSQRYTPKLTGALRSSGYLEVTNTGKNTVVTIGYAKGGSPWYAAMVHERTDKYHRPPTRSKFLQAALEEDMEDIQNKVAQMLIEASEGN